MKKGLVLLLLILLTQSGWSQDSSLYPERYYLFTSHGYRLLTDKSFKEAGLAYDSAFLSAEGKGRGGDFYNAACSWARAGSVDKALSYLDKATRQGQFADAAVADQDPDLAGLKGDKRWSDILDRMRLNKLQ